MATRSGIVPTPFKELARAPYDRVAKVWLFWAIGLVMEAIGLKPSTVSAVGLSFAIERPEVIQGFIYWVALFQAWQVYSNAFPKMNPIAKSRAGRRFAIWSVLPAGTRSLRGMTKTTFSPIKVKARYMLVTLNAFPMVFAFPPVFFILIFNPLKLLKALGAMVGLY